MATGVPCGGVGQACCGTVDGGGNGGVCTASGARCTNGTCTACGTSGAACCQGGAANQCGASLSCLAGDGGMLCTPCGGSGQLCCANNVCNTGLGCNRPAGKWRQRLRKLRRGRPGLLRGRQLPGNRTGLHRPGRRRRRQLRGVWRRRPGVLPGSDRVHGHAQLHRLADGRQVHRDLRRQRSSLLRQQQRRNLQRGPRLRRTELGPGRPGHVWRLRRGGTNSAAPPAAAVRMPPWSPRA